MVLQLQQYAYRFIVVVNDKTVRLSYRQPSDGARRGKPLRTTDSAMAQSARGSAEITDDAARGSRERGRRNGHETCTELYKK